MPATGHRYLVNLPNVRGGNTIIDGTRIGVHDVVGLIVNGASVAAADMPNADTCSMLSTAVIQRLAAPPGSIQIQIRRGPNEEGETAFWLNGREVFSPGVVLTPDAFLKEKGKWTATNAAPVVGELAREANPA
jgi:hypothetical protein